MVTSTLCMFIKKKSESFFTTHHNDQKYPSFLRNPLLINIQILHRLNEGTFKISWHTTELNYKLVLINLICHKGISNGYLTLSYSLFRRPIISMN